MALCLLIGFVSFAWGFYLSVADFVFLHRALPFDATIVEISQEMVPKGKGSVLAYVPLIEIGNANDIHQRIKVDTFTEQPTYQVGDKMAVLCDLSASKCIRNTFIDRWGNAILDLVLACGFVLFPAHFFWKRRRAGT